MILKDIDFTSFYNNITYIFSKHFTTEEINMLMEYVEILSDANFRCYKANMVVIAERKSKSSDDKLIADMEWVARSVGEYRVSSKARINNYIAILNPKINSNVTSADNYSWVSDDIVYSIGEMLDRLSIEIIKREDFRQNKRPAHMINTSKDLSSRVIAYLKYKLQEIDEKGYYECIHEQRTYDLEGIVKDLAI